MGGAPTAADPQAVAARVTEIPTNASLRRDPTRPKVEISTTHPHSVACLRTISNRDGAERNVASSRGLIPDRDSILGPSTASSRRLTRSGLRSRWALLMS